MTLTVNALFPDSSLNQTHANYETKILGSAAKRKEKEEEIVEGNVKKRNRNKINN